MSQPGNMEEAIKIVGASEHNLKNVSVEIPRASITVVTGVSGSGKSSLVFDTLLAECQRRFFFTLSQYSRQFLDLGKRPEVKKITGLSPAISLAQNETQPSIRATVGTLTDVSELFNVAFARFGKRTCPKHHLPTENQTASQIADTWISQHQGKLIAICVSIVEDKKGVFRKQMTQFAEKGFMRVYVDGQILSLSPVPELRKEKKHTIKIVIDYVTASEKNRRRLLRSIDTALSEGAGYGQFYLADRSGELDIESGGSFSTKEGCPTCGYAWPRLDSRYFSSNSLGRCTKCNGLGEIYSESVDDQGSADDVQETEVQVCASCEGTGVKPDTSAITLAGYSMIDLQKLSLAELAMVVESLYDIPPEPHLKDNPAYIRVVTEIRETMARLLDVGLGYLHLARRIRSLSGGEAQRVKLAGILTEALRGVLYILDEPSQGLHPSDLDQVWEAIMKLKELGNTVVIIDHDPYFMQHADWIIDLGPTGGAQGGEVCAAFTPEEVKSFVEQSKTASNLAELFEKAKRYDGNGKPKKVVAQIPEKAKRIEIKGPRLHTLGIDKVHFSKESLNVVTGVSGAGKTTLVMGVLVPLLMEVIEAANQKRDPTFLNVKSIKGLEDVEYLQVVDRKPIAKSSVSMPVTYLDLFTDIRNLFAKLPEAQIAGLTARSFSLSVEGGRCPECKGKGQVIHSMRFLSDARVHCSVCDGRRYKDFVLGVRYKGYTLPDILEMTLQEAYEVLGAYNKLTKRLKPAIDLGLGYLKMGQPSSSLSGGEAQRLKLAPILAKRWAKGSVLVLDEPTQGLHFEDVKKLNNVMKMLVSQGATLIVIEHNQSVIEQSNWLVELGPGSGPNGGLVVYEGLPAGIRQVENSPTARHYFHSP